MVVWFGACVNKMAAWCSTACRTARSVAYITSL